MNAWWKKLIGRLAAETCYYIGHWSWLLFDWLYSLRSDEYQGDHMPQYLWVLWQVYQRSMGWSLDVQDWGGCELPWRKVEDENEAQVH